MKLLKHPFFIIALLILITLFYYVITATSSSEEKNKLLSRQKQQSITQQKKLSVKQENAITPKQNTIHIGTETEIDKLYTEFIDILKINDQAIQRLWLQLLFQQQIQKNPIDLIKFLANLNNKKQREIAYLVTFTTWVETDLNGFRQWQPFIIIDDSTDQAYAAISVLPLGIIDISDALLWVNHIQSAVLLDTTIQQVIAENSPSQGEKLISWALSSEQNKSYLTAIYKSINNSSPILALQLFNEIETEEIQLQKNILMQIGLSLPTNKIDNAFITAIEMMQNKDLREFMAHIALPRLIKSGRINNIDQLLQAVYSAKAYPIQQSRLVAKWAKRTPEVAIQYSETIKSDQQRKVAMASVIKEWAISDIQIANEWLNQQSQWDDVELAAVKIATIAASSNESIEIALQWLPFIKTATLQNETQQRVIKSWYRYDQQSALNYLDQTDLLTFQQKTTMNNTLTKALLKY
ncbi:hypothetical protein V6255_07575 [Psychromonas arctica]|uniref:Uncharacterized protein n=1 Tax=Psychromonas arctica TaxID=168275 RepID=A0ABU9HAV0_9GAMM